MALPTRRWWRAWRTEADLPIPLPTTSPSSSAGPRAGSSGSGDPADPAGAEDTPGSRPPSLSPVRFHDGEYQAHDPDQGWRTIFNDGRPAERLVHGWKPVGLYRGFGSVLLLELVHGGGQQATWFLDPSQNLIGNELAVLPPPVRAAMEALAVPALERLCCELLTGNPGTEPVDPLGLHALNLATIAKLIALAGERIAVPPVAIDLGRLPPDQQEIVLGDVRLSVAALRACVVPLMQEQHMAVLAGGSYEATCPLTGVLLHTRTTYLDDRTGACRFETPAVGQLPGLIFYLCNNSGITERELFIPALNCTIATRAPELVERIFSRLLAAAVKHADLLPGYLAASPKRPVTILTAFPGLHMGHVLWNELTGLDRIRRTLPLGGLPSVIVPNPELGTEVFGPVERIFPEFDGKVRRLPAGAISRVIYGEGLVAMHVYDRRVSRHLAARVALAAQEDPACRTDRDHAASLQLAGRPVVLIGLRVQNRCVLDQADLWQRVIEHLCHRLGPIVLVIDGTNARLGADPSTDYGAFGPRIGRPPVLDELEIVIQLRHHFRDDAVQIINLVAAPVARSLFWTQHALFFVALWGAGLAKYRWIANKPGLVLTNRFNLDHPTGDIDIYHSPSTMEDPTLLDFILPEHVTDVGGRAGFYSDFIVDPVALLAALDRLIERVAAPGA